jgi:CRP-like cAMP-binding protein
MTDQFDSQIESFFSSLAPEERARLFEGEGGWEKKVVAANDVVFEENALSTELYLILDGQVQIFKKVGTEGKKILAVLEKGAVFGEGSLLSDKPRSASAVALTDVHVLVLEKKKFDLYIEQDPKSASVLLLALLKIVNQRLQWSNQELVTLYDVAQIIGEHRNDLNGLLGEISEKLEEATQAPQGLITLKNIATGAHDVLARWGDFDLSADLFLELEQVSSGERWVEKEGQLAIPVTDARGVFLGLIVMKNKDEWVLEKKKLAHTIMEQLGIAISDHQFVESEASRSKLRQQSIQF